MIHQLLKDACVPGCCTRLFLAFVMLFAVGPKPALPHSSEPRPRLTKNSPGVNDGRSQGGDFRIDGVPREYQPRQMYPITVTIAQPGQFCL